MGAATKAQPAFPYHSNLISVFNPVTQLELTRQNHLSVFESSLNYSCTPEPPAEDSLCGIMIGCCSDPALSANKQPDTG